MQALDDTITALGAPVLVRAIGGPRAVIGRWKHAAAIVDVAPSDSIRLALSLVDGLNARNRSTNRLANQVPGASISVFSPGEGTSIEVNGDADVIQLLFEQTAAEAMLDGPFACPPMFDLHDDWMRTMVMRTFVGSTSREPDNALAIEEELHALALRLEKHARPWRNRTNMSSSLFRGGLAPAAFRRIEALISMALDEAASLSLTEMADAVGLSVTYFARAFRRHTGSTPHKYLVRRRMDRAVSLLRATNISVAEVADRVGFSTPAHFVASFRAAVGVTPGTLRDALAA